MPSITHQYVGTFNAMGLRCDIGLGSKNRVIPLRITEDVEEKRIINGEEVRVVSKKTTTRQWLQTYDELDEIPAFFRPIGNRDYKLASSNTRNQTLFNYILGFTNKWDD